jgi:RNA polymerase sigma-70 factor (ECF subfamily)
MMLYQDGEAQAFEELYRRHQSRVYTYLHRRLKDKEVIDDVFQNIFSKFHKARMKYDPKYEVLQWIYTISRNELLDHLKKKAVKTVEFEEELIVIEDNESELPFEISQEKSLSKKEKKALELKFIADKDYEEMSELLETSHSNIRKTVSRAIKKLKLKYATGESNE